MLGDGVAYSLMVGVGENYLPAFALALGLGEVTAGLIASVPLVAGAVLQLISPVGVRWLGSYRRWVVGCATVQSLCFVPLVVAALLGRIPSVLLFVIAGTYWGAGMATSPAWSSWAVTLVPQGIRSRFIARRNRMAQFGVLAGFVGGGLALQYGQSLGRSLDAFAAIFMLAGICRFVSSRLLASQHEPSPPPATIHGASRRELVDRLKNHGEGRLLLYIWMMYAGAQISGPYFTPFILGHLKFSYLNFMILLGTSHLAKTIAMPWFGVFAHSYGSRRLMILSGFLVIPLPVMWLFSSSMAYLMFVQVCAGIAWGGFELAIVLTSFDCIPAAHRTSILTLYNLGYAIATFTGAMVGGMLIKWLGGGYEIYLVVFALSGVARMLTIPLMRALPMPLAREISAPLSPRAIEKSARIASRAGQSSTPAIAP